MPEVSYIFYLLNPRRARVTHVSILLGSEYHMSRVLILCAIAYDVLSIGIFTQILLT